MPTFLQRLQQAVGPRYVIQDELGTGGMGVVVRAHDTQLDCPVAIKALRPELATAAAAQRFLREAQTLANLPHPNIVPIRDYGSKDGLDFYIMQFLEGETVADRLAHARFTLREVRRLAEDLLDALCYAHRHGVIHRDVKPSNVFVLESRFILTDFGVAKSRSRSGEKLTPEGAAPGTPEYMPPEQAAGGEAMSRSDVYSAGMVLYEALAGREWPIVEAPERANWSGVPGAMRPVLQKALAWAPSDRWIDGCEFRDALLGAFDRAGRLRVRRVKRVAGVIVAGGLVVLAWIFFPPARAGICLGEFKVLAGPPPLADSVRRAMVGQLSGFTDFQVRTGTGCALDVHGWLRVSGDSLLLQAVVAGGPLPLVGGTLRAWPKVADAAVDRITTKVWNEGSPLRGSLPPLPVTPQGKAAELHAERLQAAGRWTEALAAYLEAEALDSTCWLCAWRITDVQRWLGQPLVAVDSRSYLVPAHLKTFPPQYQSLIHAGLVSMPQRLDTLEAAVRDQSFFLAWFHLGDELFHRGPIYGHARREAVEKFEKTVSLRPDYAPGWEHLTYIRIAEGDSAGALVALDSFKRLSDSSDAMSGVLQAFHEVGFAWRFLAPGRAARVTAGVLDRAVVQRFPWLAAGPRLLPTVGAPAGAVWLGNRFAASGGSTDLRRSGLIAATVGWLALGRVDSMRTTAARLREAFPEPAIDRFVAQLSAAVAIFDPGAIPASSRGTWLDALDGGRAAPVPTGAVRRLLSADSLARAGDPRAALAASAALAGDSAAQDADAFLRTALFLRRAEWAGQVDRVDLARRILHWHEQSSLEGWPTGDPQPNDVDWAFGTLARWRLARLLDRAGASDRDLCDAYGEVARLWRGGDALHAARADSATGRARELKCPA